MQQLADWYYELENLMWSMAHEHCNPYRFYMQADSIFSVLCEELVKVVKHYGDKPKDQLKPILIVSLRNRVKKLKRKAYGTHRDVECHSLDMEVGEGHTTYLDMLEGIDGHKWFNVRAFKGALGEDAQALVEEVLSPSFRFFDQLQLAQLRKEAISRKGLWKLKPTKHMYERAMGWPHDRFEAAWTEVVELLEAW